MIQAFPMCNCAPWADESEGLDQPVNRPGDILVGKMGKNGVGRYGTVSQHRDKIIRAAGGINRVVTLSARPSTTKTYRDRARSSLLSHVSRARHGRQAWKSLTRFPHQGRERSAFHSGSGVRYSNQGRIHSRRSILSSSLFACKTGGGPYIPVRRSARNSQNHFRKPKSQSISGSAAITLTKPCQNYGTRAWVSLKRSPCEST